MPIAVSVASAASGSPRPPKAKRVVFSLEANTRTRNLAGADIYSQVLWMKLDGLSNESIAEATGLCSKTIGSLVGLWKEQVAQREGANWQPLRQNPRKTRFVPPGLPEVGQFQHPTPKF